MVNLQVDLTLKYPSHELPVFRIRSDDLGRQQLTALNMKLKEKLREICSLGELAVCSSLQWVNDRAEEILAGAVDAKSNSAPGCVKDPNACAFWMRYWLVSHHIYRKELIQKIKSLAVELSLDGFFCSENPASFVSKVWNRTAWNTGVALGRTEETLGNISTANTRKILPGNRINYSPLFPSFHSRLTGRTDFVMTFTWTWGNSNVTWKTLVLALMSTKYYLGLIHNIAVSFLSVTK